jgi:hypothetical protein
MYTELQYSANRTGRAQEAMQMAEQEGMDALVAAVEAVEAKPRTQTCSNCHHWNAGKQTHVSAECRRLPPTVLLYKGSEQLRVWPRVAAEDWCGEWKEASADMLADRAKLRALSVHVTELHASLNPGTSAVRDST